MVYFCIESKTEAMSKAEKTRQYIIEQTAPIFNKKGYAGTSMSDLTEATGLTKGAIYGNFENKDEVALAAFKYNVEQTSRGIGKIIETRSTPLEKLQAFPDFYRQACKKGFLDLGCPIVNTAPEVDDTHPSLREAVNQVIEDWDKGLQKLVKKGIEKGEIKGTTDPAQLAGLIMSLIEGGALLSKSTGNIRYLNRALDQVDHLLVDIKA